MRVVTPLGLPGHTLPPTPHTLCLQLPLPPRRHHTYQKELLNLYLFLWLGFVSMQRAQRVSALYLPHSTFLVSWQQFSCPFPLPLLLLLCLCCRLLCLPLNCLLAFLQNTCACVCDFCFISLQFPLAYSSFCLLHCICSWPVKLPRFSLVLLFFCAPFHFVYFRQFLLYWPSVFHIGYAFFGSANVCGLTCQFEVH